LVRPSTRLTSASPCPASPKSLRLVVHRAVCDAGDGDGEEADDNE